MPAERFAPMPSPEPEELPREKTNYNIPLPEESVKGEKTQLNKVIVEEFEEPESETDIHRSVTKIIRKPEARVVTPPPVPAEALGIELDESVEELQPEPMRFVKLEDVSQGPPPVPDKARIEAAKNVSKKFRKRT